MRARWFGVLLLAAACSRPDPEIVRLTEALKAGEREGRKLAEIGPDKRDHLEPVLELMQGRGFAVCDPYADFAAQPDPSRLFLAHDSVHYSPAGHRLMCDAVRRCLGDWGFLGSATQVGTAAGR